MRSSATHLVMSGCRCSWPIAQLAADRGVALAFPATASDRAHQILDARPLSTKLNVATPWAGYGRVSGSPTTSRRSNEKRGLPEGADADHYSRIRNLCKILETTPVAESKVFLTRHPSISITAR